jgi:hypothetical protein
MDSQHREGLLLQRSDLMLYLMARIDPDFKKTL